VEIKIKQIEQATATNLELAVCEQTKSNSVTHKSRQKRHHKSFVVNKKRKAS
jgi:hypothetical protein